MARRFFSAVLGTAALLGVFAAAAPAGASTRSAAAPAPVSFGEGSCVGTCAPPNGGVPGLDPPRMPFAATAAPCDGTEPEFSRPAGNPQLNRADIANPVLRRTYSWYRLGNDPTPIKWGAHCDVWLASVWTSVQATILMPEVMVANATVPARIALANNVATVGAAMQLPSVTVPRKAPDEAYTVVPTATLTDVRWVGSDNCTVTPLPSSPVLATVKVNRPFDPNAPGAPSCVSIETTWDLKATRTFTSGANAGAQEPMTNLVGSKGQRCGDACTVTQRNDNTGASSVVAEEGVTASAQPTLAVQGTSVSAGGCGTDCAKPSLTFGAKAKVTGGPGNGNEISSGFTGGDGATAVLAALAGMAAVAAVFGMLRRARA